MHSVLLAGYLALSFASPKPAGFLAEPKSGKGPGVLVLHPWWGLNADTKAFCRRLAGEGFLAYAPDLFEGETATTPAAAEGLVKKYESGGGVSRRIKAGADYLAERSGQKKLAVVGFSFGGYYALRFSGAEAARVRSVVVFYGTGHVSFGRSKASYLGHFAAKDEFEPKPGVDRLAKALRDAGRPATIYTYPNVGHWFFEPSVKSAYNAAAADLAWKRTVQFLKK